MVWQRKVGIGKVSRSRRDVWVRLLWEILWWELMICKWFVKGNLVWMMRHGLQFKCMGRGLVWKDVGSCSRWLRISKMLVCLTSYS